MRIIRKVQVHGRNTGEHVLTSDAGKQEQVGQIRGRVRVKEHPSKPGPD